MMSESANTEVTWHDDFYRDKFARVIVIITANVIQASALA